MLSFLFRTLYAHGYVTEVPKTEKVICIDNFVQFDMIVVSIQINIAKIRKDVILHVSKSFHVKEHVQ